MELTITLDWLAFTFREDTHEAARWIHLYASDTGAMAITPTNGYRGAYRTAKGVVVQWNTDREEMGRHIVISGSALRHLLTDYELDQKALVQTVLHAGASITRLDLAKDLIGAKVSLDSIYKSLECGEATGTARSFSQIHSLNGGNTIYVGSRQSEKFIRIYDKAAQSNLQDVLWTRYEFEAKGMVARAVASILASDTGWNDCFATYTKHMVDIPQSTDYQAFFSDQTVTIGIPKIEKRSDREAWIQAQVMPAVVKHFIEHRDSVAVALLRSMLDQIDKSSLQ